MSRVKRQVIKIDEDLCNGCGLCVPACAEDALQIIDGKARLVSDRYCDGLGACLGECPQNAISFEERDAEEYDEAAVVDHLQTLGREVKTHAPAYHHQQAHPSMVGGCPSARTFDFRGEKEVGSSEEIPKIKSQLRQWPVKLNLVSPQAPYFEDADLLIAADCTPFAYASTHPDFLKGKAVVIGCPKFDDLSTYQEKLTAIISNNNIRSITLLIMEVPCCSGMFYAAKKAIEASGKDVPIRTAVVSLRGEIKEPTGLLAM